VKSNNSAKNAIKNAKKNAIKKQRRKEMKSVIVLAMALVFSPLAMAMDLESLAQKAVVELYSRPGDEVSVKPLSDPGVFRVILTNKPNVGSAIYSVEIISKAEGQVGEEVATIKVKYEGGN